MSADTTLVLCGGPLNHSTLPAGPSSSNAMIPINGRPVIAWILEDLLAKGIRRVSLVLRENDHRLLQFVQRVYSKKQDLTLIPLRSEGTILQSVQTALRSTSPTSLVRIILGDTLIRDSYESEEDFVYVGEVEDSRRWCLGIIDQGGILADFVEKRDGVSGPRYALAGYYHLRRGDYLMRCVDDCVADGERELSAVLRRYGSLCPIRARKVDRWHDFGHLDNLIAAKRALLQPRYFNTLEVDPVLNTITKVSEHDAKLRDELAWYLQLPDHLKVLTPRIVSHDEVAGRIRVVQEYYGYPTLAELYLFGELHPDVWSSVLAHVLRIHQEFRKFEGELSPAELETFYLGKLMDRLADLRDAEPGWKERLQRAEVRLNGRALLGLPCLMDDLRARVQSLAAAAPISIVHGDLCFSNILFDPNNRIIRIIDPRGSFGRPGIYGDARYDLAKLRHSVSGLYDFIVADMFEIEETPAGFTAHTFANGTAHIVGALFDEQLRAAGYDLDEIRLVEGLLFLSMLPLHSGHPARQRMMFLTGMTLLNEVLVR
jgi:dTDP-glucose pyrophosphorylase